MEPFAQGVYVNFLSNEGEDRVKDAYTNDTWERLTQIKRKYDAQNLFRMNQNIKPD
jgi:FAD/FMN-containing dehydrogenase